MIETDEALVLRCQRQDRAAFEELLRRTARGVYASIYLAVRDPHRAEDLSQETYMAAWRSIHQLTDAAGLRPWLLAIARTTTLDAQRRDSRRKRTAPGHAAFADASTQAADSRPNPAQAAELNEQRQRVLDALQSLPPEYREPLALRHLGGADYDSISRQLGLSNGSLRGLLARGMAKLRDELRRGDETIRPRPVAAQTDGPRADTARPVTSGQVTSGPFAPDSVASGPGAARTDAPIADAIQPGAPLSEISIPHVASVGDRKP